jgi:CheY-like chemotaxis protein
MSRLFPQPKPNLMIVDDDHDQLELFEITAQRAGVYWRIFTADDGDVAYRQILKWAEEVPRYVPQIVVTDLKMPMMGGIQFARALLRDSRVPPVNLIAMSSSNYEPEVRSALSAGCCAFFQKPSDFGKLREIFASLPAMCGLSPIPLAEDVNRASLARPSPLPGAESPAAAPIC